MANDLNRSIKIFIDGTPAAQGIAPVEAAIQKLEAKLSALNKTEANYETKSRQLKSELEKKYRTLEQYNGKVEETRKILNDLSGVSYNKLLAVQALVRKQLREAVPGTQQYTAALEQNRRVTEAVNRAQQAMRVEVGSQGSVFSRAAGFVNKYVGLFAAATASMTGLTMTIRKSVNDYAQIEEAEAQVVKYTGMTKEAVDDLNESLKRMDTRTSREELNQLAGEAGKLGIDTKEKVLEFVDAANQIKVALGEDLGEDAVTDIGKLAQMFGEDDRLGLRGAMLATGSAINSIGQASTASEPYLAQFLGQVGSVGAQAKLSQADLLGFGAVLDQNKVEASVASTAFQQLTLKMFQEPSKYAKIAGSDIATFTTMLKTDSNEAILQFLSGLSKFGDLTETSPVIKSLGLDGQKAAQVLTALAGNIANVRKEQETANKAYQEATSVTNEYNVQNNTVQAGLDKAKKGFQEVSYELGEKLMPVISSTISTTGTLIRTLNELIGFVMRYGYEIASLTATIGMYIAAQKIASSWTLITATAKTTATKATYLYAAAVNLFTGNIGRATAAMRKLGIAIKMNPIGLLVGAVTAAVAISYKWTQRIREHYDAQLTLNKLHERSIELYEEEKKEMKTLWDDVHNNVLSLDQRRAALEKLQKIMPEYTGQLTEEGTIINENKKNIDEMNAALALNIELREVSEELDKRRKNIAKLERGPAFNDTSLMGSMAREDARRKIADEQKVIDALMEKYGLLKKEKEEVNKIPIEPRTLETVNKDLDIAKSRLQELMKMNEFDRSKLDYPFEQVVKDVQAKVKLYEEEKKKLEKAAGIETAPGSYISESDAEKKRKADLENAKKLYIQEQAELKRIYASGQDDRYQTEKQYNDRMLELKKNYLNNVIQAAGAGTSEAADAENQLADMQIQERQQKVKDALEAEKQLYEQQQRELKEAYVNGQEEGLDSQEMYEEAKEQLEQIHLQRSLEIVGLDADARKQIEEQLLDFKLKCVQEEEKAKKKAREKELSEEQKKQEKLKKKYEDDYSTMRGYAQNFGSAVGDIISGQEDALNNLGDMMIDFVFDMLQQVVDAWIQRLILKSIASIAEAQMGEIASKGWAGIASGIALAAVITGVLAAAKSALKGAIGSKRSSSSSSSDNSSSTTTQKSPTATVAVRQWASGNYDVIGEEDGRYYRDVPYIGSAATGIFRRPSLISERGSELIVNAEDLSRLQRHINYPLVIEAIQDARSGRVPQRAAGNYDAIDSSSQPVAGSTPTTTEATTSGTNLDSLLTELSSLTSTLKNLRAYVVLRDLREAEDKDRKAKQPFTKQ
jgi:TP901 family phage tail tape measure protein